MWTADVRTILDHLPAGISGDYYARYPLQLCADVQGQIVDGELHTFQIGSALVSDQEVCFNGAGDVDGVDLSHESFYVEQTFQPWHEDMKADSEGLWFTFCKTARKPYDLAVTACLIRLAFHFPETVKISSDGTAEEWEEGRALCERLFGFAAVPPEVWTESQRQRWLLENSREKRLKRCLDNPTEETWNGAYSILLGTDAKPRVTLWQAVLEVDPTFQGNARMDGDRTLWERIPDRRVIAGALELAGENLEEE
jgi:hypothetical protein